MRHLWFVVAASFLVLGSCAKGKLDVFEPPPGLRKLTVNQPLPLPIRIATPVGVVSYSPVDPADECRPDDTCREKYWGTTGANAFDLIRSQVSETSTQCSLDGIEWMRFLDQAGSVLLNAKQGADGWNTVVVESPSGFSSPVPSAWGNGWPIQNARRARAVEFSAKPSCQQDTPAKVMCERPDCYSLRVEFLKR
jgi:hypothetical protein